MTTKYIRFQNCLYRLADTDDQRLKAQVYYYNMLLRYIKQSSAASSRLFDSIQTRPRAIKFLNLLEDAERALEHKVEMVERGATEPEQQTTLLAVSSLLHKAIDYADYPAQMGPINEIFSHISPEGKPK